jgi:hypothetical protein
MKVPDAAVPSRYRQGATAYPGLPTVHHDIEAVRQEALGVFDDRA